MLHCIDNEQTKHRIEWELSQMLAHSFTRIFCPVFSFCSMFDPALLRPGLVFYLYVYVCVCVCGLFTLTAVGCMDPGDALPAGTWLERSKQDKHLALVRCQSSQESWQVTCQHGGWSLDNVGNCTATRPQVEGFRMLHVVIVNYTTTTTFKYCYTATILLVLIIFVTNKHGRI